MRRSHECAYDDSYRKSRTQTLREKMVALEAKVRELESQPGPSNPSISSPTVFGNSVADNLLQSGSSTLPFLDTTYDGLDPLYSMEPSSWTPFDLQYSGEPIASSSSSNLYMPTPFDSSLSQYPNTRSTPIRPRSHLLVPIVLTYHRELSIEGNTHTRISRELKGRSVVERSHHYALASAGFTIT